MLERLTLVQTEGGFRAVTIPESVLQAAQGDTALLLRLHGIDPDQPYSQEDLAVHGIPAHRYIQPPRPAATTTAV